MDILSNLTYSEGSIKKRKRIGRGVGSGHGKTSGKGNKGQRSRAGAKFRAWFEGGQMPLQRRVPKFGFTNSGRVEFQVLNLGKIQSFFEKRKLNIQGLNPEIMYKEGLVSNRNLPLKILGNGDYNKNLEITAHKFSKSAIEKIEKNGGKVTLI